MSGQAFKLCFTVPREFAERVKEAVFSAGAGRLGSYDRCCWQTAGSGQFRPLEGSRPFCGETGRTHVEEEVKVEMICDAECVEEVLSALRRSHPYECPALDYWRVNL